MHGLREGTEMRGTQKDREQVSPQLLLTASKSGAEAKGTRRPGGSAVERRQTAQGPDDQMVKLSLGLRFSPLAPMQMTHLLIEKRQSLNYPNVE